MDPNYPDFEQPIVEIDAKITALRSAGNDNVAGVDSSKISEEINELEKNRQKLIQSIFSNLKPIQVVQLARHTQRPYFLDYISRIFTEFDELQGDRCFSKGFSIIGGLARLENHPVVVIGHQKGRKTAEKLERNFGMARPEDYRKALRLMKLAEKFHLPLFTFIDTPGAYPGMDAEEHNQSEAIARNLFEMSRLKTPIVSTIIGEGGSGGALGIAVGDRLLMLQYSTYSVISPEGCAAILWKDSKKAPEAAEIMGLTADRLLQLSLIDVIIPEPLGGAHRNIDEIAHSLKQELVKSLNALNLISMDELLKQRYQRLMAYGL